MYRKIVWCYVTLLTLLDISLNSKLSAQGKSHGTAYSVHDTLAEAVNFQEWDKESESTAEGLPLRLFPAALSFGARPLGAAHAAAVTLLNMANVTLHLASVAGTTPDFHASFFDTKTLPPQANTTFNVVFLGRREGPAAAHLYIHTSLGAHKYPVSAVGVASQWEVWPLLGVRVPANATLEPQLQVRNPTDTPVQVTEVYSSGSWVKLVLPDEGGGAEGEGGGGVPAERWLLPPHSSRCIVRLRLQPPPHQHAATAYVRIKTNTTSGSGLIVAIEARAAAAGEFASPLQLRVRARGHRDPHDTWEISVGNSASTGSRLEAGVTDARCDPYSAPRAPAPPPNTPATPATPATPTEHTHHNGVKSTGAVVSVTRPTVDPFQPLTAAARLTLNYSKLWEEFIADPSIEARHKTEGALCGGSLTLGRAAVPYSLRLLPGTLALAPTQLHLITSELEAGGGSKEIQLTAHNQFSVPVRLAHLHYSGNVAAMVDVQGFTPQVIPPGEKATVATFGLKDDVGTLATLDGAVVLHTNVSAYTVPLRVYSGRLELEWEWPNSEDGQLNVGAVGTSSTRRITARLHNPAPAQLCVRSLRTTLPGSQVALTACAHIHPVRADHRCRCIEAGGWSQVSLTVVAPARAGPLRGSVAVGTAHALSEGTVTLTAHQGKVVAQPLVLDRAAPYAWAVAPVIMDNSMSLRMRVTGWSDGAGAEAGGEGGTPDLALVYRAPPGAEVAPGTAEVGAVTYMPERVCEPNCYTGLDAHSEEGKAWVANGEAWNSVSEGWGAIERALRADRALLGAREALMPRGGANISLHVHTSQVVQIPVWGQVRLWWPRVSAGAGGAAGRALAAVGGAAPLRVRARNPSRSHHLLLQPVLGPPPKDSVPDVWVDAASPLCGEGECVTSLEAFRLGEWRTLAGEAREWPHTLGRFSSNSSWSLPLLWLGPSAEVELHINFVPREPALLTAYLYLRNNLTIVEGLQLAGRGAYPSFELGGRRGGSSAPLVFEVTQCGGAGAVKRVLAARNTGGVAVRLRDWRVAGAPCQGRGFALTPCAPLALQPNKSSPITITFTPDFTLARVPATLELRTERSRVTFQLAAVITPKLLAKCSAQVPKPPFDPALRAGGTLLALALLALVLAAAALDAERLLRKARAVRAASQPRAPLDLRAVAAAPAPTPPPPAPRAPPPRRKKIRKMDPAAESRAFERWRASLRRTDDTDSRSSEDLEPELTQPEPLPPEVTSNDNISDNSHVNSSSNTPVAPPPPYEPLLEIESNQHQPSSGEDEPHSSESESSSPLEQDDEDRKIEKPRESHEDVTETTDIVKHETPVAPVESQSRTRRRDSESRRTERRSECDSSRSVRASGSKHHTRKDKPRARRERAAPTPPRTSPPNTEPRGGSTSSSNGGGVRWGASWSSVVARSSATPPAPPPPPAPATPLAPLAPEPSAHPPAPAPQAAPLPAPQPRIQESNSLFYFNGDPPSVARPDAEYAWRASPTDRPFPTPTRDFLGEDGVSNTNSYGSIGSGAPGSGAGAVAGAGWGGAPLEARAPGAHWPWASTAYSHVHAAQGAGPVRPPPGFGSPPTTVGALSGPGPGPVGSLPGGPGPVGSRAVRPFDPFQSLAAIWSRTALDWRNDDTQQNN